MGVGRCVSFMTGLGLLAMSAVPESRVTPRIPNPVPIVERVVEKCITSDMTLYDRLKIAIEEPDNQAVFREAQRLHRETGFETGGRIIEVNGRLVARLIPNEFDRGRQLLVDYVSGNRDVSTELTSQINQAVSCGLYNLNYVDMGHQDLNGPIVQYRRPGGTFMHPFPHPFPFARRVRFLPLSPLSRDELPALCSLFFHLNTLMYLPEQDGLTRVLSEGKPVAGFHLHPTYHPERQASEIDCDNSHAMPEVIQVEQGEALRLFYLDGGAERELGALR
jgi:hypothetical protein